MDNDNKLWLTFSLTRKLDGPDAFLLPQGPGGMSFGDLRRERVPHLRALCWEWPVPAEKLVWHHSCKSYTIKISNHSVVPNRKDNSTLLERVRILELPHSIMKQILGGGGVHLPENAEKQCFLFKTHRIRSWSLALIAWESDVLQHPVTKLMAKHEFHSFWDVP